jgi:hypothetical protein
MTREPEPWGGEVRLPGWLRRMLRQPAPVDNTQERVHEGRRAQNPVPSRTTPTALVPGRRNLCLVPERLRTFTVRHETSSGRNGGGTRVRHRIHVRSG